MKILLILVVIFHIFVVIFNLLAIPYLCIYEPWYVSLPLISFLLRLALVERECPLTYLENMIRSKLGMKRIGTFIGHYIIKYLR
jgi:hypothetical protein